MEEKEEFSWTTFLIVTGFCSFVFGKVLYLLDGSHLPIFTWIAGIAFLAGSLNSIRTLIMKSDK